MNSKTLILLASVSLGAFVPCSCKQDEPSSPVRSEFIKVYETAENKTVDNIQVPCEGIQDGQIHILSNVDLQWRYFVNPEGADADWFTIKAVDEIEPGHMVITYDAQSLVALNSLDYRSSRLSFSCPEQSLGKFLSVRQGFDCHFTETFDDEPGAMLTITGMQTYTTPQYPQLNVDFYDYISFNAWAETDNEFLTKNITLDITISGGLFYATGLKTYRINVPLGTGPEASNFKYLLVMGIGERLSAETTFTFSTANDDQVYVHVDNFSTYQVTEADMNYLFPDDELIEEEEEGADWI